MNNIFDDLPAEVSKKAKRMLLWVENSRAIIKVESKDRNWQKEVKIENNEELLDDILGYMNNLLAYKILIMKAEHSGKTNRTHEIATSQIIEDNKKKVEWSWPWT